MVAQITASIELGTKEHTNIRLIAWPEILASERTPEPTRTSPTPATIRVSYSLRGETRSDEIIADARPFGLERTIDGRRSYLFFPGIEADCATEPLDASDADRSSIAKKFAAYAAIGDQGIFRSHFGFPNFFVPFVTTSTRAPVFHDGAARPPHRRARLKDVSVQDVSELDLAATAAAGRRPHADRAVAAGRLPAALSRSLNESWTGAQKSSS